MFETYEAPLIIQLAWLFAFLEDDCNPTDEKVEAIKNCRENGLITEEQAFDIALYYFTNMRRNPEDVMDATMAVRYFMDVTSKY